MLGRRPNVDCALQLGIEAYRHDLGKGRSQERPAPMAGLQLLDVVLSVCGASDHQGAGLSGPPIRDGTAGPDDQANDSVKRLS